MNDTRKSAWTQPPIADLDEAVTPETLRKRAGKAIPDTSDCQCPACTAARKAAPFKSLEEAELHGNAAREEVMAVLRRYPGLHSITALFAAHGTSTEQFVALNGDTRDAAFLAFILLKQAGVAEELEIIERQYRMTSRPTPDATGTVQ